MWACVLFIARLLCWVQVQVEVGTHTQAYSHFPQWKIWIKQTCLTHPLLKKNLTHWIQRLVSIPSMVRISHIALSNEVIRIADEHATNIRLLRPELSKSCRCIFARSYEITQPWGVPNSVSWKPSGSITPHPNYWRINFTIRRSLILFSTHSISRSWLILSRYPVISASSTIVSTALLAFLISSNTSWGLRLSQEDSFHFMNTFIGKNVPFLALSCPLYAPSGRNQDL